MIAEGERSPPSFIYCIERGGACSDTARPIFAIVECACASGVILGRLIIFRTDSLEWQANEILILIACFRCAKYFVRLPRGAQ
jgi:hypothetical protein